MQTSMPVKFEQHTHIHTNGVYKHNEQEIEPNRGNSTNKKKIVDENRKESVIIIIVEENGVPMCWWQNANVPAKRQSFVQIEKKLIIKWNNEQKEKHIYMKTAGR